jgi:hypothetical protein
MDDFVLEAFGDKVITAENLSAAFPAYEPVVRNSRNRHGLVRDSF